MEEVTIENQICLVLPVWNGAYYMLAQGFIHKFQFCYHQLGYHNYTNHNILNRANQA